jgi:hypothetical protein
LKKIADVMSMVFERIMIIPSKEEAAQRWPSAAARDQHPS